MLARMRVLKWSRHRAAVAVVAGDFDNAAAAICGVCTPSRRCSNSIGMSHGLPLHFTFAHSILDEKDSWIACIVARLRWFSVKHDYNGTLDWSIGQTKPLAEIDNMATIANIERRRHFPRSLCKQEGLGGRDRDRILLLDLARERPIEFVGFQSGFVAHED